MTALAELNGIPNIQTLAYVHTANRYDCGSSGIDICVCTAPLSELEANITTYQDWPTAGCGSGDIHVDGLFIDESPSNADCVDYMRSATTFAKSTLTRGNTVLFNAGSSVDSTYWSIADYINVFENSQAVYNTADIGALDGNGVYSQQTALLIYGHSGDSASLQRDVQTVLSYQQDAIAGLYISDLSTYAAFPTNWNEFVSDVAAVVAANTAA